MAHEHLNGTDEAEAFFRSRLQDVYKRTDAVLVGSVGRTAVEWALGWPRKRPLTLARFVDTRRIVADRRDIDVFSVTGNPKTFPRLSDRINPIQIDNALHGALALGKPLRILSSDRVASPPLTDVLNKRERTFAGEKVRTLRLGDFYLLESIVNAEQMPEDPELGFGPTHRRMTEFVSWAKRRHPSEFANPRVYAPFEETARAAGKPIDILLH